MKYNLLDNSYITSSGTITLTVEDMINILSVSGTVTISGSGNDNVWIDCGLVDRIVLEALIALVLAIILIVAQAQALLHLELVFIIKMMTQILIQV